MFEFPSENFSHIKWLYKKIAALMLILFILRIVFFIYNQRFFTNTEWGALAYAFVVGSWYDLSLLTQVFFPLLIFALFPWKQKIWRSRKWSLFTNIYFWIAIPFLIIPNIVDIELFHFLKRRSNADIFENWNDISKVAIFLIDDYWHFTLLGFVSIMALAVGVNKIKKPNACMRPSKLKWVLNFLVFFVVMGLSFRGSYRGKPLRAAHAGKLNIDHTLSSISLNSSHSILHSINQDKVKELKYYESDLGIYEQLKERQKFHFSNQRFDNVVILILESIGSEFVDLPFQNIKGRMPFLQSLGDKGLYYPLSYAGGITSRIAPYSIFASLPEMTMGCLLYSPSYSQTSVIGMGSILDKYGYDSAFFHNGKKGVFHFDTQAYNAGLKKLYAYEDFKGEALLETFWGWDDVTYARFMLDKLDELKAPFVAGYFTLSNHYPYLFPAPYDRKLQPGEQGKYLGAEFTDYMLKDFFEKAESKPWFKNTLFIITGDHGAHERNPEWESQPMDKKMVPLVFYHPSVDLKSLQTSMVTGHTDILPSVLDFLGVANQEKEKLTPFGKSVFVPNDDSYMVFGGDSCCVEGVFRNAYYNYNFERNELDFKLLNPGLVATPGSQNLTEPMDEHTQILKKYLQYYNNGVKNNKLFPVLDKK